MIIANQNSLAKSKIKILLLEGLHPSSLEELKQKYNTQPEANEDVGSAIGF